MHRALRTSRTNSRHWQCQQGMAWCVRPLDNSRPFHCQLTTLNKLFTQMSLSQRCTMWYRATLCSCRSNLSWWLSLDFLQTALALTLMITSSVGQPLSHLHFMSVATTCTDKIIMEMQVMTHIPQLISCNHRVLVCWWSRKLPSKHLTGHSPLQRQQPGTVRTATTTPQFTRLLKTHLFTLGWSFTVPPAPLTHYLLMNYGAVIQIDDWLIDWLIKKDSLTQPKNTLNRSLTTVHRRRYLVDQWELRRTHKLLTNCQ